MACGDRYVIECRHSDGSLDLSGIQPEQVFGIAAIKGITEDEMARVVFRKCPNLPDGAMHGMNISVWPRFVDSRFVARRKTW